MQMVGGGGVWLERLNAEGGTVSGPVPLAREAKFFRLLLHFFWRRSQPVAVLVCPVMHSIYAVLV
jgi:hypothetical protein